MRESQRLLINASSVFVKMVALIGIGLILPPFVIGQLGKELYGLAVVVITVTQMVQMLNLGVPQSLNRYMAGAIESGDDKRVSELLSSGLALLCGLACIGSIITFVMVLFPTWFVERPENVSVGMLRILFTIIGLGACTSIVLTLGHVLFIAREKFVLHSGLQLAGFMSRLGLVVGLLTVFPGSVMAYVVGNTLARKIEQCLVIGVGAKMFRSYKVRWSLVRWDVVRRISTFGVSVLLNTIALMLFAQVGYIVIGKTLGNGVVATYSLAFVWILAVRGFASAVLGVLTPRAARQTERGEKEITGRLLLASSRLGMAAAGLPLIFLMIFRKEVITLWVGPEYMQTAALLVPLAIGEICHSAVIGPRSMLIGMGRVRFLLVTNIVIGLCSLMTGYLLATIGQMGIWGFALAYAGGMFLRNAMLVPMYLSRLFGLGCCEYIVRTWLRPLIAAIGLSVLSYALREVVSQETWVMLGFTGALISLMYVVICYSVVLDSYERRIFHDLGARAFWWRSSREGW